MTNITLPQPVRLLSPMGWTLFIGLLLMVGVLVPVLNLWLPVAHPLHMSDFAVSLIGKIMCFAICALAMDLIWGYTGILSLGHGLFFALGGYAMGMYLMRQIGTYGNYKSELPDFMVFWIGKYCLGIGTSAMASSPRCCWWCWHPVCWRWCSVILHFVRVSKGCISPSSRRR